MIPSVTNNHTSWLGEDSTGRGILSSLVGGVGGGQSVGIGFLSLSLDLSPAPLWTEVSDLVTSSFSNIQPNLV